jgi:YVTN family beta-propeller protein
MLSRRLFRCFAALAIAGKGFVAAQQLPQPIQGGYQLPNGWRITPMGTVVHTEDMVLNIVPSPDGRAMIALHAGFSPHGLVVIDAQTGKTVQRISLKSAWLGMAWHPDGKRLYVSGGNADGKVESARAPIYIFQYENGRLSNEPVGALEEPIGGDEIYWSGLVHDARRNILYAANRGTGKGGRTLGGGPGIQPSAGDVFETKPTNVVVFDTATGKLLTRIPVGVNPYDLALSDDGRRLFVSNWASDSVTVIDTGTRKAVATIPVGHNPTDMELSADGRLFVACANENSVVVIDTEKGQVTEKINTALFPLAPVGSTPNALVLDRTNEMLFAANADNNDVAVIRVAKPGHSELLGFIPAGWYPSALAIDKRARKLYIGNSWGNASFASLHGPYSPVAGDDAGAKIQSRIKGTVNIVSVRNLAAEIRQLTKQVYENCPYNDQQLKEAKMARQPSVIPRQVGAGSAIKRVLYIIKENRTYDQVLGDLPKGNGDQRLAIFGEKVTPNQRDRRSVRRFR